MRLFFDHQAFSLQKHGGITTVFREIIRYLNKQSEVSTDVLLGVSDMRPELRPVVARSGRLIHLEQFSVRPGLLSYAMNEVLCSICSPFLGRYDVYHSTLYRFVPSVRANQLVITHHDCIPELFPEFFPDAKRIMHFKRKAFQRADLIICVSQSSRADLMNFYDLPPGKAVVIHNGASIMKHKAGDEREVRAIAPQEFLLYVGVRPPYKNFAGFLKAFHTSGLAAEFSAMVVGGGPPTREERQLIEDYRLGSQVKFISYSTPAILAKLYAEAKLLVYPSFYEGFGMPPLEAASAGCVSLVAAHPACLEICGDSVFHFAPSDPDEFVHKLRVAVFDQTEREIRLERARRLLHKYTWEECGRKTLAAYRAIA
jgi:glycosyltransferase involved in cell wall biosynthesis